MIPGNPKSRKRTMHATRKLPSTNMAPGSLRVPEGAVCPTVLQAIRYTPETCEEQEFSSVAEAVAWQAGKGVLWLNIDGWGMPTSCVA